MLDEKDLQTIAQLMNQQKTEILEQSAANMQVVLESYIGPQFRLLFEKLDDMEARMVPAQEMEDAEDRLDVLEATAKHLSREIEQLKKAQ